MANTDDKILRLVELARAHGASEDDAAKYLDELQGFSPKRLDAELAKAEKAKAAEANGRARCRVIQRVIHGGQIHEPGALLWLKPEVAASRPEHLRPL